MAKNNKNCPQPVSETWFPHYNGYATRISKHKSIIKWEIISEDIYLITCTNEIRVLKFMKLFTFETLNSEPIAICKSNILFLI